MQKSTALPWSATAFGTAASNDPASPSVTASTTRCVRGLRSQTSHDAIRKPALSRQATYAGTASAGKANDLESTGEYATPRSECGTGPFWYSAYSSPSNDQPHFWQAFAASSRSAPHARHELVNGASSFVPANRRPDLRMSRMRCDASWACDAGTLTLIP